MSIVSPPNASEVRALVQERLQEVRQQPGTKETVTVEWRGQSLSLDVISMPVKLVSYNPDSHRIRAQRSLDAERDQELIAEPFGPRAQKYLHDLLVGDPADPTKPDASFEVLKDDLRDNGQADPGVMTQSGLLVNGNTRAAALRDLGVEHIRVGVLPTDTAQDDVLDVELSLQLRKNLTRDYSFMNRLLAIDERVKANRPTDEILRKFRIKAPTLERDKWILELINEAIRRSTVQLPGGKVLAVRMVDFETHQGKLEELYRTYATLKARNPHEAEALREQRLMAIALDKSKTDVRFIEPNFADTYMKEIVASTPVPEQPPVKIPGTSIVPPPPPIGVQRLRALTTSVLRARAVTGGGLAADADTVAARQDLERIDSALEAGLTQAGKSGRLKKQRLAPVERLDDVREALELTMTAISEARSTNNFSADEIDESLVLLKAQLTKLAQVVTRGYEGDSEGVEWLRALGGLNDSSG